MRKNRFDFWFLNTITTKFTKKIHDQDSLSSYKLMHCYEKKKADKCMQENIKLKSLLLLLLSLKEVQNKIMNNKTFHLIW